MYLAIDLGGQSIKHALINEKGEVSNHGSAPTHKTYKDMLSYLTNLKTEIGTINGVGCSFPGAVDNEAGTIKGLSAIPYIHGPKIKDDISKIFNVPVAMLNDANAAGIGETWTGSAKNMSNVVFMVVGTGIGGALIIDGKVVWGKHLYGGELGFLLSDVTPKGEHKILSSTSGTYALMKNYSEAKALKMEEVNGKLIFEQYFKGDEVAKKYVDYMVEKIAIALFNIQHIVDPEVVIIGGAISQNKKFIKMINDAIGELRKKIAEFSIDINVKAAENGNDANLIGAVKFLKGTL